LDYEPSQYWTDGKGTTSEGDSEGDKYADMGNASPTSSYQSRKNSDDTEDWPVLMKLEQMAAV
jgi:hypothetical protein